MDLDPDRVLSSPFTVGGFGAVVALKFAPGTSWWERVTNVASGALAAGYLAPALVDWLQLKTPGLANASAFVIGLLGMSLIAALLQGIRDLKLAEILSGWLARR
ncbi:hypothetical protein CDN99_06690 [Roseateles aquatilis]|uniref:Holin n=1 Tax=Roseateles aquatilis TaxID=431061 RepID=A0A246JHP1_9BURK|nr:hypothetical protein [Roseateles aquatilis]OWQ92040.1 hypothetical protein CDN99_06690 [Roseateles aquatilis]